MCDAFRDLVPFLQFQKRKKYPWSSVTFSKVNKEMIAKTKNNQKFENLRPTSILPSIHGYLLVHKMLLNHFVKSVQIRSFFWSVFGHFSRSE